MAAKVLASCGIIVAVSGARLGSGSSQNYNAFKAKFGVVRPDDTVSFEERAALFLQRKEEVTRHNSKPGRRWTAAVNKFADFTEQEFNAMLGHKRSNRRGSFSSLGSFMQNEDSEDVAQSVDWRGKANASMTAKDQGGCGSCWAVAAAGALETHADLAGAFQPVSYEQLVDCVQNPDECGGSGGCHGATPELAFDYVQKNGIGLAESYQGYQSGGDQKCKPPSAQALTTTGFVRLPENELQPLMNAVANIGPVTVSSDASRWGMYQSGVFDGCNKDAIINHAILLMGYGTDEELHSDYWLIRNSWGSNWGEQGYIRLLRHDTDKGDAGFCGTDTKPLDGVGCKRGPGVAETLPVCGMCGVLSDSAYPIGVKKAA